MNRFPCWLSLVGIVLAACAGAPAATGLPPQPTPPPVVEGVRPLSEILVSGPEFADPRPNSVTILVETRVPMVCAAAYGTTTSYGSLATDTDMAGAGHTDHHPLLTGLQPDTEYHMRFQGVAPDGTLYQSEDYVFRTPPAETAAEPPAEPAGRNMALRSEGARVVAVSSIYGGGDDDSSYGANKAIDGNRNTAWSSDGDGDEAFIEIGLAQETRVTAIGFWTRTMGTSAQILSFLVVTDRGETYGPFELADASGPHFFEVDFTATRLRFEAAKTTGGNTGAVEIAVYTSASSG